MNNSNTLRDKAVSGSRTRQVTGAAVSVALAIVLAACGGGGGGGGNSSGPGLAPSKLFIGDAGNQAIPSFVNSNPSAGTVAVDRIVSGPSTQFSTALAAFALDVANDRLYVADLRSILVFDHVSAADGDVAPRRVLTSFGPAGGFSGLYLDTTNDVLYASVNVSINGVQEIRIFNNASSVTNAQPSRTLTIGSDFTTSLAVDASKKILYVYLQANTQAGLSQISVFDNVDNLTGSVTPDRVIAIGSSFSSGPPRGVFLDSANDRLYVSDFGKVFVFDSAHNKDGSISTTAAPERTIELPLLTTSGLAVDMAADRLYAVDTSGLNIISNASTANGAVSVTRLIAPNGASLKAVAVAP